MGDDLTLSLSHQQHSKTYSYKCGGCDKSFETKGRLKNHKQKGAKKCRLAKYASSTCSNFDTLNSGCVLNIGEVNGISAITENIQNHQIINEEVIRTDENHTFLEQPQPVEKSKAAYNCNVCVKDTINKNKMAVREHKKRHVTHEDGLKEDKSDACHKGMEKIGPVAKRMKTGEALRNADDMAEDSKLKDSSVKYPCDVCSKQFCNKYALIRHMLSHGGDSPYLCIGCDQIFSTKSNIELHNQEFHSK